MPGCVCSVPRAVLSRVVRGGIDKRLRTNVDKRHRRASGSGCTLAIKPDQRPSDRSNGVQESVPVLLCRSLPKGVASDSAVTAPGGVDCGREINRKGTCISWQDAGKTGRFDGEVKESGGFFPRVLPAKTLQHRHWRPRFSHEPRWPNRTAKNESAPVGCCNDYLS